MDRKAGRNRIKDKKEALYLTSKEPGNLRRLLRTIKCARSLFTGL